MKNRTILIALILTISLVTVFTFNTTDATSIIPQWIKNNAKWWSDGTITDSEYISAIQYLTSQGIIKIPIQQVIATNSPTSDSDSAKSLVVNILAEKTYTYNTFEKLIVFGQTIQEGSSVNAPTSPYSAGQFELESIPSKDKQSFYNLVSKYINPGSTPNTIDVNIDVLSGDGKKIETLNYQKCHIIGYWVYTNTDTHQYRLGNIDGPELRDQTLFLCSGFGITLPS